MKEMMKRLWVEEEGQGLVEYALIIALIAVLLVSSLESVRNGIAGAFNDIVGHL